jgi:hypothetical protein
MIAIVLSGDAAASLTAAAVDWPGPSFAVADGPHQQHHRDG